MGQKEENDMKTMLASAALAATVLGTAVPASAQWYGDPYAGRPYYGDPYVARPYYGPGYSGYSWGGPRVYVAPPVVSVAPAYPYGPAYRYGPAWGGPFRADWD
jgi:hypothetical protein